MANGNHAINLIKIAIRVLIGPMGPIRPISPILLFFSPGISAPTNRTASKSLIPTAPLPHRQARISVTIRAGCLSTSEAGCKLRVKTSFSWSRPNRCNNVA